MAKAGKRLTRRQWDHIASLGMDPADWLLSKKLEHVWTVIHRATGQVKEIRSPEWT